MNELEHLRTTLYQLLAYTISLRQATAEQGLIVPPDQGIIKTALVELGVTTWRAPPQSTNQHVVDRMIEIDQEINSFFQAGFEPSS